MKKELELYVHIPFCVKKCGYCDFLSFPGGSEAQRQYVDALKLEIGHCMTDPEEYRVSSVFFGGGTPSLLPAAWTAELLGLLQERFPFGDSAEITMEANPGTVDAESLRLLREAGFNRLSFGCQSAEDEELQRLGRIHSWKDFLMSWELARAAGFENLNLDLMSGLPGQTAASWERTLRRAAELQPEHISAYSLILEEGTPFYRERESLDLPDEEEEREMYECTGEILGEYGLLQYEISNYARKGYECRHNLGYWTGKDYLGLGLGASSLLEGVRFHNTQDMKEYLASGGCTEQLRIVDERLSREERQAEFMILGLRLIAGVSELEFEKRFGQPLAEVYSEQIEKYRKLGLLKKENGRIALTRRGISLSNTVMADFLP